jgi:hypothetical protein
MRNSSLASIGCLGSSYIIRRDFRYIWLDRPSKLDLGLPFWQVP